MLVKVKAIPRAKKIAVKKEGELFKVYLTAPAQDGQANNLLVGVLAEYFKVKQAQVEILRGEKSRHKLIKIDGLEVG